MLEVTVIESVPNSVEHENVSKVAYAFGLTQCDLGRSLTGEVASDMDWEDIHAVSKMIYFDWNGYVDIQNKEEEGYIIPYAIRKWGEYFCIK